MRNEQDIIITTTDLERLQSVLDIHDTPAAESLATELHRALVVDAREVPADVVTMNSEVVYEDVATRQRRTVRLVYPKDANTTLGWVSVLAPIGSALIGLRVGQEIEWQMPNGRKQIRVVEISYQPESAADLDR